MSQENVDVLAQFIEMWRANIDALRQFTDSVNRRDLAALLDCCDPEIEVVAGRTLIGAPVYSGHREMERWLRDIAVVFEKLRAEPLRVMAVADNALVVVHKAVGTGTTTGVPFEAPDMATYFKFAHGKVARCEFFVSEGEALEGAGLRE